MGKIIKRLVDVLFIGLIILLAGYFIFRELGVIEIYQVETGSMESGIHVGDYVLICRKNKYVVGDIVTYKKSNYFITHRIIKSIHGNKVITKGDANNIEDEEITMDVIVGKVIYVGGLLNAVIDYKYGIVSFMLGLYLLSCYVTKKDDNEVKDIVKKEKVEDKVIRKKEKVEDKVIRKRLKKRLRPSYR